MSESRSDLAVKFTRLGAALLPDGPDSLNPACRTDGFPASETEMTCMVEMSGMAR